MTEEATTTGSEIENGTAVAATEQSKATQPEQSGKSIFDGFTAEDKAYLDKKGWNAENYVEQSFKAYRNLEKMMGGSKDVFEFPKEGDSEGYANILYRLGTPDSKDGYSYDLGENSPHTATMEHLKDVALKSKMTKSQFGDFMKAFIEKDAEVTKAAQEAYIDEKKQQLNRYAADKGYTFADIKENTDRAMRMYNLNDNERLAIENSLGIDRFFDIFSTIGKNLKEGTLVTKANDSTTNTPETYKLELDKLFADSDFMTRYMSGEQNAINKVADLNNKISGGK